jgi:hypothetical protein
VALLGRTAPRLVPGQPLLPQLEQVVSAYRPGRYARVRGQVTSMPGQAQQIIRSVIYHHLGLPEPIGVPDITPVPLPRPLSSSPGSLSGLLLGRNRAS